MAYHGTHTSIDSNVVVAAHTSIVQTASPHLVPWTPQEEQLRGLHVRNAEAERLFSVREQELGRRLQDTQSQLEELTGEHHGLKQASTGTIGQLQAKVSNLQDMCQQLEVRQRVAWPFTFFL